MLTRNALQAFMDRMAEAYGAGDARACADMFCEQAQLHSPYAPPAIGREAIRALHEDWTGGGGAKSFTVLDHGGNAGLAWCLCRFSEGTVTGDGTSLLVLQPGPDGGWLVRSCCLFGDD